MDNKLLSALTAVVRQEVSKIEGKLNGIEVTLNEQNEHIHEIYNIVKNEENRSKIRQEKVAQPSSSTFRPIASNSTLRKSKKNESDNVFTEPRGSNPNRNAVAELNERYCNVQYIELSQSGPSHKPTFNTAVKIEGQTFSGFGSSKKEAKNKAAELALKSVKRNVCEGNTDIVKGAVMQLNEYYPDAEYQCVESGGYMISRFTASVTVEKQKFTGTGATKQEAKTRAAADALSQLKFNSKKHETPSYTRNVTAEEQDFADHIGRMVQEKFKSLTSGDYIHSKRKVLAGFVLVRHGDLSQAEVISVTTGTKCISGGNISQSGSALNDMHAEILSRRCLIRYFYDQLDLVAHSREEYSIFTKLENKRGYKLREGFEFHLYISTAPCGDASVFTLNEDNEDVDSNPNRAGRGLLRSKIENGEGSIPVDPGLQTWDGILQGNRLLTMTCSDEICRWNVLGLQGAALTHFIEPIYLKSIVLGNLFHEEHLRRALCGRIETKIKNLRLPFSVDCPEIYKMTTCETRQASNSTNFSVIWYLGSPRMEIIDAKIGKPNVGVSRFCKLELGKRFVKLVGLIPSLTDVENCNIEVYGDIKSSAQQYMAARDTLFKAFEKGNFGSWKSKPVEQDMFVVMDSSYDTRSKNK